MRHWNKELRFSGPWYSKVSVVESLDLIWARSTSTTKFEQPHQTKPKVWSKGIYTMFESTLDVPAISLYSIFEPTVEADVSLEDFSPFFLTTLVPFDLTFSFGSLKFVTRVQEK